MNLKKRFILLAILSICYTSASFASDTMLNTEILPAVLKMASVQKFIGANSHDLRMVSVSGLWSCGGVGLPQCGDDKPGLPNGYISIRLSFYEPTDFKTYLCQVELALPGLRDVKGKVKLTGELTVDEQNSTRGCSK